MNKQKIAMYILACIVLAHVVLVLHIIRDNRINQQKTEQNALVQKIMNVIHIVRSTPMSNRKNAIDVIDDPAIKITLTKQPASAIRYHHTSYWRIEKALEKDKHAYFISIQLSDGTWLNVKATAYTPAVLTHLLFIAIELIIFGFIFITFYSMNRFKKPLEKIKSSAEQLGINLEKKHFDVYGPQVVREASEALNKMQDRIVQLVRNRTQMLASISHDLRTPIARAQLRAQFIEDSKYKTQLLADLNEMEHMISETLLFALEESKQESMVKIDLVSLLESICDDASDMGHAVTYHASTHRIAFTGRPIALKRMLTNVINNAIRYAGNAIVSIEQKTKCILITIEDNGPGIPESELEKVFEPFYRAEHSRSRNTGGVGLGLSVAHDVILAHHGKIKLTNRKPHGLRVLITFKT